MEEMNAKAVMMGDKIYAGIDEDDICEVEKAIVIEFETLEMLATALRTGKVEFGMFESFESKKLWKK